MRNSRFLGLFAPVALAIGVWMVAPGLASAAPDCVCRYQGAFYKVGKCICIKTPSGSRTACCRKVLNNSSWSFVADSCQQISQSPIKSLPDFARTKIAERVPAK